MEPDAWFTSVRHLQFMAAALKLFHEKKIEVKSFDHLKEQLIRYKFRARSASATSSLAASAR